LSSRRPRPPDGRFNQIPTGLGHGGRCARRASGDRR
jgi:hypothetical protein